MVLSIAKETMPLKMDEYGVVRVGGTRVTLETVVVAFEQGEAAEEIMQQYPTLRLSDIYFTIGYYLQHRAEVDEYLRLRQEQADRVMKSIATPVDLQELRNRLAARQAKEVT